MLPGRGCLGDNGGVSLDPAPQGKPTLIPALTTPPPGNCAAFSLYWTVKTYPTKTAVLQRPKTFSPQCL